MPLLVCPNCDVGMTNVQRSGVEIDICPKCRGVWLDRGELEKLLEPFREAPEPPQAIPFPTGGGGFASPGSPWAQPVPPPQPSQGFWDKHFGESDHHRKHGHDAHHAQPYKSKSRGLLDIFD